MSDLTGPGTDLLPSLDHFADDGASPADSAPSSSEGVSLACPDCDYETPPVKTELGAKIALGRHRAQAHPNAPKRKKSHHKKREPGDPPPAPRTGRKSAADLLSLAASAIGSAIGGTVSVPAGMALKLEAPMVGPVADQAAAGTIVDRLVLQKAVAAKGKFEKVGPLIAFPVLVGICDKRPEMRPQLYPALRMCVVPMLPELVKAMRKQADDDRKLQQAAADLSDMDPAFAQMFAGGVDPVDALLAALFPETQPMESDADEAPAYTAGG